MPSRRTTSCSGVPVAPASETRLRVGGEPALGELEEALSRLVVRAERRVARVGRVGGDLLRDGAHLPHDLLVVARVLQQLLGPGLLSAVRLEVILDQQAA